MSDTNTTTSKRQWQRQAIRKQLQKDKIKDNHKDISTSFPVNREGLSRALPDD